jgi:hypothetical protein
VVEIAAPWPVHRVTDMPTSPRELGECASNLRLGLSTYSAARGESEQAPARQRKASSDEKEREPERTAASRDREHRHNGRDRGCRGV